MAMPSDEEPMTTTEPNELETGLGGEALASPTQLIRTDALRGSNSDGVAVSMDSLRAIRTFLNIFGMMC